MKSITIFPGKMEAIGQALDLFGDQRVSTGEWNEPIRVSDLTAEEVVFAKDFFANMNCEVAEMEIGRTANAAGPRTYVQSLRAVLR